MTPTAIEKTEVVDDQKIWHETKIVSSKHSSDDEKSTTTPSVPIAIPSKSEYVLQDHPIDKTRKLKVAVIGAGIAGITAGVLLPAKVPGIKLEIFDKNAEVGGTWFENIYPGVCCDIPAHVYQATFESNTQWSEQYAQGSEILEYWKRIARKYQVYERLRLQHQIDAARWDDSQRLWTLEMTNLATRARLNENFDVVITAIGRFNAWKLPDYPGLESFAGILRHSSNWDPAFDPAGKTIAVIGNGASGIQVVPNLQKVARHLDHYARSPTWIAGSFGGEGAGRTLEPQPYAPELREAWAADPTTYVDFRRELESKFYTRFATVFRGRPENDQLRTEFTALMGARLHRKPKLVEQLMPAFAPNCRRLTPGPGYLEALTADNVRYITTPISHFTSDAIVTTDGVRRQIDAVICCTGANRNMHPPFPITIRMAAAGAEDDENNQPATLQCAWTPAPTTYLGLATPGFPNLLFIAGPNSTGHSGTVPSQVETQVTYLARLLRKVQAHNVRSFAPRAEPTLAWNHYADAFFAKTVWTESCRSWANGGVEGGRVHGHWPGSATHANITKREPRWEDWDWTYDEAEGGEWGWLGNGWSGKEEEGGRERELVSYLKRPDELDLRTHHEEWF